jgi:MFS transporter, DHA3 family, macrolide efflux protein
MDASKPYSAPARCTCFEPFLRTITRLGDGQITHPSLMLKQCPVYLCRAQVKAGKITGIVYEVPMSAIDTPSANQPGGLRGFTIVWAGQLISVLATSMTSFALTIWMFNATHSATAMGILAVAFVVPNLVVAPFAGALVDRYNRKLMMMVSDLVCTLATLSILILQANGNLQSWHLYMTAAVRGFGAAFQLPAYYAAISGMIPKEKYGRANGMMSLIEFAPAVFSPILAGLLLPGIGLTGILIIDVLTFGIAVIALLAVHIPAVVKTVEGQAASGNLLKEAVYGFQYIFARPGLLGLLLTFLALNLFIGLSESVMAPMILTRTNSSSSGLAAVESAAAVGGVIGGVIMSVWGSFKRRFHTLVVGWIINALFGMILFGLGRSVWVWIPAVLISLIVYPITGGASQAIWQAKVAPDVQGRVFSARRMIAWLADPITPIAAGLLADKVTEPAMRTQGGFAKAFAWLVGSAPGSGMAVQYVLSGVAFILVVVIAWSIPVVRNVEGNLPDHDQLTKI